MKKSILIVAKKESNYGTTVFFSDSNADFEDCYVNSGIWKRGEKVVVGDIYDVDIITSKTGYNYII